MALQIRRIDLAGGLDESSGYTAPRPGRLIGCENFEIIFGQPGYRRIDGYERFDGRAAPSDAVYYDLPFDTGTAAIAAGNVVTGPSGSGTVIAVALASGSWVGGNAAGTLRLVATTGTFADNDVLQVSAAPKALAAGALALGTVGGADYTATIVAARTYYRNLIQKPPGQGAILGVAIYNNKVHCLRDAVGGATATLWASSAAGWVAVRTGLRPGGTLRHTKASFTGLAGQTALYGVDGRNRPWQLSGSTFTFLPAIYPTEGTSTDNRTPGFGLITFTTETGRVFTTGQEMIAYSASNAANFVIGLVSSSTASSVTLNVTSFGGVAANDWHIARNDRVDRPYNVAAHKNHLFLAYPLGQLQHSNLGDPLTYTSSAGVIAFGDEIVDLKTLRADVLCVTQLGRVSLIYGSGKSTWENKQHSESSGARAGSTQEIAGNAVYLNDAGIMNLAGSQAFGDFDAANVGRDALRTLRRVMQNYRCTSLVKSDSQYRVYGDNCQVLVMAFAGGSVSPKSVAFTKLRYLHQPVCTAWDVVNGEEYIVFGTSDGWVMRERVGTTFDGANIGAFLRTSYWHNGTPSQRKRMRLVTLDCDADDQVPINFKLDFDFAGPDVASTITFEVQPAGGFFDVDYWDEFFWSAADTAQLNAHVEGIGKHISLMLWSDGDTASYRVYGMSQQYSPLEITRGE